MRFTHKQYAQALYESFHDTASKDHDKVIANFIEVLKSNGDLREYEKIIDVYAEYDRNEKGIKQVELTTARPMEANRELVNKLNDIAGGQAELQLKVDDRIVGGVIVKIDDTMIDGSVKNQLNQLRKDLTN